MATKTKTSTEVAADNAAAEYQRKKEALEAEKNEAVSRLRDRINGDIAELAGYGVKVALVDKMRKPRGPNRKKDNPPATEPAAPEVSPSNEQPTL